MRKILLTGVLSLTFLAQPGCAAFQGLLPEIVKIAGYVQDAEQVLELVQQGATLFFDLHPMPAAQTKFEHWTANARIALNTAQRIANGAQDLGTSEAQFETFRKAWVVIVEGLVEAGVLQADGTFSAQAGASSARSGWAFSGPLLARVPVPQIVLAKAAQ